MALLWRRWQRLLTACCFVVCPTCAVVQELRRESARLEQQVIVASSACKDDKPRRLTRALLRAFAGGRCAEPLISGELRQEAMSIVQHPEAFCLPCTEPRQSRAPSYSWQLCSGTRPIPLLMRVDSRNAFFSPNKRQPCTMLWTMPPCRAQLPTRDLGFF